MNDERRHDEELDARRLDWALREVVGEQRAPDVTAAVLARAAAGDRVDGGEAAVAELPSSRARWLVFAALFLLGVLTVLGTALLRREGAGGDPVDEAQGPKVLVVTRAKAIAALPRDLKAVELRNLDDAAVAALVQRCPDLEHLCVFASTATVRSESLVEALLSSFDETSRGAAAVSITDEAFAAIGSLTRLRRLELVGVQHVKGTRMRELERLPLLTGLTLSFFDLDDDSLQVLPRLPSLRALDLEGNQGYGERGLAAIGACPGLRSLSLSGSAPLPDEWFAPLAKLTSLQSLDLKATGLSRRLLFAKGFPEPRVPKFDARSIGVAALQQWPALRTLSLANALHIEPAVGAKLARECPALQTLVLDICLAIDDTTVANVLALRFLRSLSLRDCPKVTETSLPLLVAAQQLREVHFGKAPWLTLAHAEQLMASGKLVTCSRPEDPAFEADLARLQQRYRDALAAPQVASVRSVTAIAALPDDVTHVEARGLGDRAARLLGARPQLRHVAFVRDDDEPFTTKGLQALAKLPQLEHLELNNLPNLEGDALSLLRGCQTLRSLDVVGVKVDDAALQALPEMPALAELSLAGVRTFGVAGVRAITKCRSLRLLRLAKCNQLDPEALSQLGAMRQLTDLDVSDNPGLLDRTLMSLRHCTAMRSLLLADGQFSSMAMQAVADMRELKTLRVGGNDQLVTSALLHVPVGVEELGLASCRGMGADAGPLLRDRFPGLRGLDIADNPWVTDEALAAILQCPQLTTLDVRGCGSLTTACFAAIRDARQLRKLDATRSPCLTDELAAELARLRPDLAIVRKVW